jgi:hypothetical protein
MINGQRNVSLVIDWHWPYMAIVQPARNVCVHTYLLAPGDLHKFKKKIKQVVIRDTHTPLQHTRKRMGKGRI